MSTVCGLVDRFHDRPPDDVVDKLLIYTRDICYTLAQAKNRCRALAATAGGSLSDVETTVAVTAKDAANHLRVCWKSD
jgi:hypothetical protein